MKELFYEVRENSIYTGPGNKSIAREYGKTPNGNSLNGAWVLRDAAGRLIDWDRYCNDLAERHNIELRSA